MQHSIVDDVQIRRCSAKVIFAGQVVQNTSPFVRWYALSLTLVLPLILAALEAGLRRMRQDHTTGAATATCSEPPSAKRQVGAMHAASVELRPMGKTRRFRGIFAMVYYLRPASIIMEI